MSGDGHTVYWETIVVGTRGAKPAVFLHGGPGGATGPGNRRLFDPALYDVLMFDPAWLWQVISRMPRSKANTTWHLVADIRAAAGDDGRRAMAGLRRLLGLDAGACLCRDASERVSELVLRGIYTLTARARLVLPVSACPNVPRHVGALHRPIPERAPRDDGGLSPPAHRKRSRGAVALRDCLEQLGRRDDHAPAQSRLFGRILAKPNFALAFARIENHFFVHDG